MFAYITWQRNDKEILIVFSVMPGPETSESHLPYFLHVNCVHPVIARWHPRCAPPITHLLANRSLRHALRWLSHRDDTITFQTRTKICAAWEWRTSLLNTLRFKGSKRWLITVRLAFGLWRRSVPSDYLIYPRGRSPTNPATLSRFCHANKVLPMEFPP